MLQLPEVSRSVSTGLALHTDSASLCDSFDVLSMYRLLLNPIASILTNPVFRFSIHLDVVLLYIRLVRFYKFDIRLRPIHELEA